MQQLPTNLNLNDTQEKWSSILNPVLANPSLATSILPSVQLVVGSNVINHKLGRPLKGWRITRMRGVYSQVFDTQDTNNTPQLTLALNSSAAVTVDLEVF